MSNNTTVIFEGVEYVLTQDAYLDNLSNGEAGYRANAMDAQGNIYQVVWETTEEWKLIQELDGLQSSSRLSAADEERLAELEAMLLPYAGDESDACDWDNPIAVRLIEHAPEPDGEPDAAQLVYNHPALAAYVPSAKTPHLDALAAAGLLDSLTTDQAATLVRLMQAAYQQGRAAQGAEKIDADAVWINGVGLVERLPDGRWELTGPDGDATAAAAAATLGRSTSPAKAAAARANGKRGGWPKGRPRK